MAELVAVFDRATDQSVKWCECNKCSRAFYVPTANGTKWQPNFCPFCGTRFDLLTEDGSPMVYDPVAITD